MARKKLTDAEKAARAKARREAGINKRYKAALRKFVQDRKGCRTGCVTRYGKGTQERADCYGECSDNWKLRKAYRNRQYQKSMAGQRKARGPLPPCHKSYIKYQLKKAWKAKRENPEYMRRYKNWHGKTINGVKVLP